MATWFTIAMTTNENAKFEVAAVLLSVNSRSIRSTYDTMDEALSVAEAYREAGFFARVTIK